MKKLSRKKFIRKAVIAATSSTALISSCASESESKIAAPNIITNKKFHWRMVTTWPPNFPVFGEGCTRFAQMVKEMSGGRLEIKIYGSGELVPALECFEATRVGAAEMYHGASYYWAGKDTATQFFASIPFGMNAQQMHAWILNGGGYALWREVYDRFDLIPFLGGNSGVQMGGWFNKEINSKEDIKGLKMRIPGLGGKVLEKAGGAAVLVSGGELYTSLERGVIDATEWVGPYHDYLLGLYKIAKYYYAPGWHEPGSVLETVVNKQKYNALPLDLQKIIEHASHSLHLWGFHEFESKNNIYLDKIKKEGQVEMKLFPQEVLDMLRGKMDEAITEIIDTNPMSKKVYKSFSQFAKQVRNWSEYSEKLYHNRISPQ